MSIFDKFFEYNRDLQPIKLGDEFPYKEQVVPGDFTRPMLTAESIDVLISLSNLSPQEEKAIGDEKFEIYIHETALAPMVALKFGDVITTDFTINLSKMDEDFLDIWLNSEIETMTIYLLEGTDSTVRCVRFVPFKNMKYLKGLCRRQLDFTPQEVDQWLLMCNSKYTTGDIIQNANVHECIPEAGAIISEDDEIMEQDDEEIDKEEDEVCYATREEMKAEAIQRMISIGLNKDVLRSFSKDDEPQVYEPPYGASYALDEEQKLMVRYAETNYGILVWGVIRCYMPYNGQDEPVDCMLYVYHEKDTWEQERENLYQGTPHVFTFMPSQKLRDSGCIYVYKSEGGTILRKLHA